MDEEDELALKLLNAKSTSPMTEDQFEEVMTFFEETVAIEQPFASMHNTPIMSLEELLQYVTDSTSNAIRLFSKIVYEHWAARRIAKDNHALPPQLKFEAGQDSDDVDPYVCFRRREIRQTRKTRHRDQLSADKLKTLRHQLENARNVLLMVKQREQARKDLLEVDKQVFEQRQAFRELKRKLKQPGDDDLLITQKKPKLPPVVPPEQQLAQQIPARPGPELKTIEDIRADRERAIANEIQTNVEKHIRWNDGYHDKTMFPLTPETDQGFGDEAHFLPAMPATIYLPTPPASISADEAEAEKPVDAEMKDISQSSTPFRYASPASDDEQKLRMPAFRRRIGRGGRVILDRKMPFRTHNRQDDDRFKFDHDSDDAMEDDPEQETFFAQSMRQSNERSMLLQRTAPVVNPQAANARIAQIDATNAAHAPAQPSQQMVASGS